MSMLPSLNEGDRVLVWRYWPKRWLRKGQIVILQLDNHQPINPSPYYWKVEYLNQQTIGAASGLLIKRVVALGGEMYQEFDTGVTQAQNTPKEWLIPPDYCFVCGDNLDNSRDSRYWGAVPVRNIKGVMLMQLPRSSFPAHINRLDCLCKIGPPLQKRAPAFEAKTAQGEKVGLDNFLGQTIVLVIISIQFVGCREILATYLDVYQKGLAPEVKIIIVSLSTLEETTNLMAEFSSTSPVLLAPENTNSFKTDYRVPEIPFFCTLDAQGIVQTVGNASHLSFRNVEEFFLKG